VEVVAWSNVYEPTRELWEEGNTLIVQGKVRVRNDKAQLNCDKAERYRPEAVPVKKEEAVSAVPIDGMPPAVKSSPPRQRVIASPDEIGMKQSVTPEPPPPTQAYRLVISLTRTDDKDADLARLYKLGEVLQSFPGKDEVILNIVENGDKPERLRLTTTGYCPELHRQLVKVVGEAGLGVETR
ncbi:MAG: hypothetical protein HY663_01375, partial [Chloroflexi bacterium]|nr:hypothetical protein [Chloroflexota bacterium]